MRSCRSNYVFLPCAALLCAALLCTALLAGACAVDVDALMPPAAVDAGEADAYVSTEEGLEGRPCPEDSELRYQNFGAPFFYAYCTGCHSEHQLDDMRQGAPLGLDFDTLDKIREAAPVIYAVAADDLVRMPPTGGPELAQRQLLGEWLACGAPE